MDFPSRKRKSKISGTQVYNYGDGKHLVKVWRDVSDYQLAEYKLQDQ